MDVSGKVALVTGAGRGIGRGIATVLARRGADVVVTDVNLDDAMSVGSAVRNMGRDSLGRRLDVTDADSVGRVVHEAVALYGRIDILVNNAGVIGAPGWDHRGAQIEEDWDLTYAVNLKGLAFLTQAVTTVMKARQYGKIVNIASVAGRHGSSFSIPYSASKAGVINYTQALAMELAPFDINVNAICPGQVWTNMAQQTSRRGEASSDVKDALVLRERFERKTRTGVPLGRPQTPEDIGNLAAFLASDYAKNITGQAIDVSGGSSLS